MSGLKSYDQVLSDLRARLKPAAVQSRALAQAVGHIAAEDVRAHAAVPTRAQALRDGYEMPSQVIAGASSYAPMLLESAPRFVAAGDALSPDCDCVVEASGLDLDGPLPQALVESFPGENIRRMGEDFATGAVILRAGEVISSQRAVLLSVAGVTQVNVRLPVVALRGEPSPLLVYLRDQIARMGVALDGKPDLIVDLGAKPAAQRLALEPGADIALGDEQSVPVLHVPPRMDQVFATLHGFLCPALGLHLAATRLPLAQKIASRVGIDEIALLEAREGQFHLRALGDLPLQSLASATHVSLIAALSEGHAAGEMISAVSVYA